MKQGNMLKGSLILASFKLAKSNLPKIGMMILFDAMFVISFFIMQKLSAYAGMRIIPYVNFSPAVALFLFSAIYYLIILLIYSFFKYGVLSQVRPIFAKSRFAPGNIMNFYLLNIIIAMVSIAVMLAINYVLMNMKPNYAPYAFLVFTIPFALALYASLNISQSLFFCGNSVAASLKKGFKITFEDMKSYREILLAILAFSMMFWLLFLGTGYLVRSFTSGNYQLYLSAYARYAEIVKWAVSIAAYAVVIVGRISFYFVAKAKT